MDKLTELREARTNAAKIMRQRWTIENSENYAKHYDALRDYCLEQGLDFMLILISDIDKSYEENQ